MRVTPARFEALADAALERLPRRFLALLEGVELGIKQLPGPEAGQWRGKRTLLGLYVGAGLRRPARIVLYQRNLEELCKTEAQLAEQIGITLRHEIGHHFGLDDGSLRKAGH